MMVREDGRRVEDEAMDRVFVLDAVNERELMARDVEPAGRVYFFEAIVNVVEEVDVVLKCSVAV